MAKKKAKTAASATASASAATAAAEAPSAAPAAAAAAAAAGPQTGIVYDERVNDHRNASPGSHVEQPMRATFIAAQLEDTGVLQRCCRVPARPAEDSELLRVHTPAHLRLMHETRQGADLAEAVHDHDMFSCTRTETAARVSCGGLVDLTTRVTDGRLRNGFAVIRPPGHHSDPAVPSGFCIYSNVAVAARAAQQQPGVKRVMIFDWDVHHGNGTENVFYDDPSVLTVSVHGHGMGKSHAMRSSVVRRLREEDKAAHDDFLRDGRRREAKKANDAGVKRKRAAASESDESAADFFNGLGWAGGGGSSAQEDGDDTSGTWATASSSSSSREPAAKKAKTDHVCNETSSSYFYPGTGFAERTGVGSGVGHNINIPWPCDGFGDLEYLRVVNEVVLPVGREFKPDLLIVSAGFDCALGDKLGAMRVTPSGFAAMTEALGTLCDGKVHPPPPPHLLLKVSLSCPPPPSPCDIKCTQMVIALEGGYNTEVNATCAEVF